MRVIKIFLVAIFLCAVAGVNASAGVSVATDEPRTETAVFNVSLSCNTCKAKIEKHIPFEKGVKDLKVNVAEKSVTVTFDPRKTSREAIGEAIGKLGFSCSPGDKTDTKEGKRE